LSDCARLITAVTGFLMPLQTWPKLLGGFPTFGREVPSKRCLDKSHTIFTQGNRLHFD